MGMPTHIFISLGNILSKQFREEAEKQKKEQEQAESSTPSLGNLPNVQDLIGSMNIPNFNMP